MISLSPNLCFFLLCLLLPWLSAGSPRTTLHSGGGKGGSQHTLIVLDVVFELHTQLTFLPLLTDIVVPWLLLAIKPHVYTNVANEIEFKRKWTLEDNATPGGTEQRRISDLMMKQKYLKESWKNVFWPKLKLTSAQEWDMKTTRVRWLQNVWNTQSAS